MTAALSADSIDGTLVGVAEIPLTSLYNMMDQSGSEDAIAVKATLGSILPLMAGEAGAGVPPSISSPSKLLDENYIQQHEDAPVLAELYAQVTPLDVDGGRGPWEDENAAEKDPYLPNGLPGIAGQTVKFTVDVAKVLPPAPTLSSDAMHAPVLSERDTLAIRFRLTEDSDEFYAAKEIGANEDGCHIFDSSHAFEMTVDEKFIEHVRYGKIQIQLWKCSAARKKLDGVDDDVDIENMDQTAADAMLESLLS